MKYTSFEIHTRENENRVGLFYFTDNENETPLELEVTEWQIEMYIQENGLNEYVTDIYRDGHFQECGTVDPSEVKKTDEIILGAIKANYKIDFSNINYES